MEKFLPTGHSAPKTAGNKWHQEGPLQQKAECSLVHSAVDGQSGHTDLSPAFTDMAMTCSSKQYLRDPLFLEHSVISAEKITYHSVNLKVIQVRCAGTCL